MNIQSHDALAESLRGALLQPDSDGYDDARSLYNGMIDKRPAVIASCTDVADVIAAVRYGRDNDLLIAIRGGGHSGPGLGSCDGGLMIDLSGMTGVHVDPEDRTVQLGPGCTQGDMDHATHAFSQAVPAGIVSTTGVAGLTLGGGHGYLTRMHGLTIDNLVEADVVLASGDFVTASADDNSDLFWALRGGGGNFGIVTRFVFRTHPVSMVHGGPIFWDAAHTTELMRWFREFQPASPREFGGFLGLKKCPSTPPFPEQIWGKQVCAVIWAHAGSEEASQELLQAQLADLPEPLMNATQSMPYPALQSMFDPLLPKGLQWYWKGDFVRQLPDEAIAEHVRFGGDTPGELSLMHLYAINGAVHDVDPEATAWHCRDATWSMVIAGIDPDPGKAKALREWGRGYWNALHEHNQGGGYVNFMMEDEIDDRLETTYGPNYPRLKEIKRRYDPENLFRVNQNIAP